MAQGWPKGDLTPRFDPHLPGCTRACHGAGCLAQRGGVLTCTGKGGGGAGKKRGSPGTESMQLGPTPLVGSPPRGLVVLVELHVPLTSSSSTLTSASRNDGPVPQPCRPLPIRALLLEVINNHRTRDRRSTGSPRRCGDVVQGISSTPQDALHCPLVRLGLLRESRRWRRHKKDGCPTRSIPRIRRTRPLARATHDKQERRRRNSGRVHLQGVVHLRRTTAQTRRPHVRSVWGPRPANIFCYNWL